jgi:hypothetical protein
MIIKNSLEEEISEKNQIKEIKVRVDENNNSFIKCAMLNFC